MRRGDGRALEDRFRRIESGGCLRDEGGANRLPGLNRFRSPIVSFGFVSLATFALFSIGLALYGTFDRLGPADVAVVLGNTVERDGRPSRRLAARLDQALALYRRGAVREVIVSGGREPSGFDEAAVMKQYLARRGIPSRNIVVDSLGRTTWFTAMNCARIMKRHRWRGAVIVTQYFHVARTRLAFRRFGIAPVYSAHARFFELRDLYSIPREGVGFWAYCFRRLRPEPERVDP